MTTRPELSRDADRLVRTLWQYCNVLRDDGLSYPDYVEQLTYLLFLKMGEEQGADSPVPSEYAWASLIALDARAMHRHYTRVLGALGRYEGLLGLIFRHAKNKIKDPAKLRLLVVGLIGPTKWSGLSSDVKGDAYEGLLEKNARDTKSGAGQYFTPRPLVDAIVECVNPRPGETVCDPACGTGGFLLAAHSHVMRRNPMLTVKQQRHVRTKAFRGVELVEEVARLAAMNLLLHGIGGAHDDELPIECKDSLRQQPASKVDIVLTNPPFGIKGSVTYSAMDRTGIRLSDDLSVVRPDFWVQTANKQLNFLQHVISLLAEDGRAAVVIPDNVLVDDGIAAVVRRRLLDACDVHTLLRLPRGLFYAQTIKANVLFFDKMPKKRRSSQLWVYDLRSGHQFSRATRPLKREDLQKFVGCYSPDARRKRVALKSLRWSAVDQDMLLEWNESSFDSRDPEKSRQEFRASRLDEISQLIVEDLQRALSHINRVAGKE